MGTEYSYIEALDPVKFEICGVDLYNKDLHGFSLGHWMILERFGSPFLSESAADINMIESAAHLCIFLIVCGQTYEQNLQMLDDPIYFKNTFHSFMNHLNKRMLFGNHHILNWFANIHYKNIYPFKQWMKIKLRKFLFDPNWNLLKEISKIKEYLEYFSKMPNFDDLTNPQTPSDSSSGIDWKQNLYTILKNEYHYSESEILNMNMRKIFYEWCSYAEKNGGIKVKDSYWLDIYRKAGYKV